MNLRFRVGAFDASRARGPRRANGRRARAAFRASSSQPPVDQARRRNADRAAARARLTITRWRVSARRRWASLPRAGSRRVGDGSARPRRDVAGADCLSPRQSSRRIANRRWVRALRNRRRARDDGARARRYRYSAMRAVRAGSGCLCNRRAHAWRRRSSRTDHSRPSHVLAMTFAHTAAASSIEGNVLSLVRLLQLASPALPIGGYSYSQGLEWMIDCGAIRDAAAAQSWIGDMLEHV